MKLTRRVYRGTHRVDVPINSIRRWGTGHFVHEVKALIEAERQKRGYYPPLPDIYAMIAREFGADFARESVLFMLPVALRWWGVPYSAAGAREYKAQQVAGQPLLDVNAPYRLPFGTVGNYLLFKLPRLVLHGHFEVEGLVIRRVGQAEFSIIGRGVRRSAAGGGFYHAIARVLMVLRDAAPEPAPEPAPVPLPDEKALPPLVYSSTAERQALAREYLAKGYTMAQIQAALVRSDLANGGQDDVQ